MPALISFVHGPSIDRLSPPVSALSDWTKAIDQNVAMHHLGCYFALQQINVFSLSKKGDDMLNNVEKLASESLAWSMMPLQQWAQWSDCSRKTLDQWVTKTVADQDQMLALAKKTAEQTQQALQSALEKAQSDAKAVASQAQAAVADATEQSKAALESAAKQAQEALDSAAQQAQEAVSAAKKNTKAAVEQAAMQAQAAIDEVPDLNTAAAPFVAKPKAVKAPKAAKQTQPETPAEVSSESDDLTRISGVGPALAKKLVAAGYTTFGQIAELSDEQIAELESSVIRFSGRIQRDGWKAQARDLMQGA